MSAGQDRRGCVRKGEKGSRTVYAETIRRAETAAVTGVKSETRISFMKGYNVFNVEQIDGFMPDELLKAALAVEGSMQTRCPL